MKSKKRILIHIAFKRHLYDIKHRKWKKRRRMEALQKALFFYNQIGGKPTLERLLNKGLSENTKYLFENEESPLNFSRIKRIVDNYGSVIMIPEYFSIIENPKESYEALRRMVASLFFHKSSEVIIDYTRCKNFTLEAQVLLDLIIKDVLTFYKICNNIKSYKSIPKRITDRSVHGSNIRTMLFSVGSQAIHANRQQEFANVIPYNLRFHKASSNSLFQIEQKELDTTSLSDYVEKCLARMGRRIDDEAMDDLCTVIGEILINAEEHSSTKCRYSIGCFEEKQLEGNHIGFFQLVILNIGRTIYEKFHDEDCPNKKIVEKMKNLSDKYTKKKFWQRNTFEEESLWTLYSLQDGVTSVSPNLYEHRGNGSCRFIESFFNLRSNNNDNKLSRMTLQSGKTSIIFDGKYGVTERVVNGDNYKVMTFNTSGNIEDKPDTQYVRTTDFYFPGTFICANIIF